MAYVLSKQLKKSQTGLNSRERWFEIVCLEPCKETDNIHSASRPVELLLWLGTGSKNQSQ